MTRNRIATTAITNRMWMTPPALYPIKPINHPRIRMTAMTYNKFPILVRFNVVDAEKDLQMAQEEYLADIKEYKILSAEKIAANDKSIAEFS
jgi:hypothetical protein